MLSIKKVSKFTIFGPNSPYAFNIDNFLDPNCPDASNLKKYRNKLSRRFKFKNYQKLAKQIDPMSPIQKVSKQIVPMTLIRKIANK